MREFSRIDIDCLENFEFSHWQNEIDKTCDTVVLALLWEATTSKSLYPMLTRLIAYAHQCSKKVIVVVNTWYQPDAEKLRNCGADDLVFLDFFLTLVYYRLTIEKESPVELHWNPGAQQWLFLTGKANKPHRVGLLYELWKNQLLDKCIWSLFFSTRWWPECRHYLPGMDEQAAMTWMLKLSRSPDGIEPVDNAAGLHYSGIPYGNIYESALFQVVPESTIFRSRPWLTEKTWLPIINRRPFLILGDAGTRKKLKNLGFDTFDSWLVDTIFDENVDIASRMESLIKNIKHWQHALAAHESQIQRAVDRNHQQLVTLASKNLQMLWEICQRHSLIPDIKKLVGLCDPIAEAQWKNWYARVRDPAWPDCDREEDFSTLPDWIQRECQEVFGYRKTTQ